MSVTGTAPFISLWFGNFFEPFHGDDASVVAGVADVASLGFTSINLDSKPWTDFFERYRGGPASRYVATQELMMAQARLHGLDHTCLALYLCGDNLYPTIRDAPPVRGKEAVLPDGTPMGTYDYRAPEAHEAMVEHMRGLLDLYGAGMHRTDDGRTVMQTMFEPLPRPSFDDAGREHHLRWLRARYDDDAAALNRAYGTRVHDIGELTPHERWLRPDELTWVGCALPDAHDLLARTPDFTRWVDNRLYLADLLDEYLGAMRTRWDALDTPLFVEPVLHQWGYFFNPPGHPDWQTGQRALDVYRCARHVDGVLFIAAPLDAEDRPSAAALSVESSIARCANDWGPYTGGLYLGRHVNVDVYEVVSPAEAVATHVANGARRLHAYGYSGLDDGGVLYRADEVFRASLAAGNAWAAQVMPRLHGARAKETAVLFPAATSLLEPVSLDPQGRHRMDLLGWHRQFVDLGWHCDVVHPDQVLLGGLAEHTVLAVPADPFEDVLPRPGLEQALRDWVEQGGVLLHGPGCTLAERAFGVHATPVPFEALAWTETVIPHGWSTVAYDHDGEVLATYLDSGRAGLVRTPFGRGAVVSFGFEYGYAYGRSTMPVVPARYGRREMHPLVTLRTTPVHELVGTGPSPVPPVRGLEVARIGDAVVAVNHRSSPVPLGALADAHQIAQVPAAPGYLAAHAGTCLWP